MIESRGSGGASEEQGRDGAQPSFEGCEAVEGQRGKAAEGKEQGGTHQVGRGDASRGPCTQCSLSVQVHHTGKQQKPGGGVGRVGSGESWIRSVTAGERRHVVERRERLMPHKCGMDSCEKDKKLGCGC